MEQTTGKEIRFSDLWSVFKKCWIIVLAVLIVATLLVYAVLNALHEDRYTSTSKLYVLSDSAEMMENKNTMSFYQLQIADMLIVDFTEIAYMEDPVLRPTLEALNLQDTMTVKELASMIRIEQRGLSRVLYVSATTPDAQMSERICNTFVAKVCEYFNSLYTDGTWQIVRASDQAKVSNAPSNPISMILVLAIGLMCAVLVYVIYLVRFLVDDKINSAEDVEKYLGLSMLGVIPNRHIAMRRQAKYGTYQGKYGTYGLYGKRKHTDKK